MSLTAVTSILIPEEWRGRVACGRSQSSGLRSKGAITPEFLFLFSFALLEMNMV